MNISLFLAHQIGTSTVFPFLGGIPFSLNEFGSSILTKFTECSVKICIKVTNATQQPLNMKWSGPFDKSGKFHSA